MDYSSQLNNVKSDGSGNVSPEGEAFVLLMESARREWIDGGGNVEGLMGVGTSAGVSSRQISSLTTTSAILIMLSALAFFN
jgi:hypothetical protein